MLVLGGAGVNSAQADHDDFAGKTVIKEECHNGTNKPIKRKIKSEGFFRFDPASTGDGNLLGKKWDY